METTETEKVDKRTKAYRDAQTTTEATDITRPRFRKVFYVQIHDAFTPLRMAPVLSLGMTGNNAMALMEERPQGIFVRHKTGREFIVPYGNISFYEYPTE